MSSSNGAARRATSDGAARRANHPTAVGVTALVISTLLVSTLVGACAGRPDPALDRSGSASPTTPAGPVAVGAASTDARNGATPAVSAPAESVCAEVTRLYAGMVAGPLGLVDGADPADRQALAADTAARRARVPAAVAHDLDVLAQAYGGATRAVDEAGTAPDRLDPAVTSVTAPAVVDAGHDLDRYLRSHCP